MEGLLVILVVIIVIYFLDKNEKKSKKHSHLDDKRIQKELIRQKDRDKKGYEYQKTNLPDIQKIVDKIDVHHEYITGEIVRVTKITDKRETIPYIYCLVLELISIELNRLNGSISVDEKTWLEIKRKYKTRRLIEVINKTDSHLSLDKLGKVFDDIYSDIERISESNDDKSLRTSSINWLITRLRFSDITFDEKDITQKIDGTIKNFTEYFEKFLKTNILLETPHSKHST